MACQCPLSLLGLASRCRVEWISRAKKDPAETGGAHRAQYVMPYGIAENPFGVPGGGDDGVPRYFFIVAYPDREFDDPDGTLLPATRLRSTTFNVQRLAEELREDRQPGEPDMTMIVKNAEGVVIYSAPV
jgi:hypothetical protein